MKALKTYCLSVIVILVNIGLLGQSGATVLISTVAKKTVTTNP
jgi:hypothetical protein